MEANGNPGVRVPCRWHTVREGDSIASIAARLGVSAARLMEMNPYIDPEELTVGQPICVPEGEACASRSPQEEGCESATVRYGQTYAEILMRHDLSYQAFRMANPHLSPVALLPGQRYCIPGKEAELACPPGAKRYDIPEGGTLTSVARNLHTTVGRLLRLNPALRPSEFVAGRQICV